MTSMLDTQANPEIQAADSRFFIDTGLDTLRASMVARISAIVAGKKTSSPLVEHDIDAFREERKEFEQFIATGNALLQLSLPQKANRAAYGSLIKDYALPSEDGRHVFGLPSSQIVDSKLVPEQDSSNFTSMLSLDLRIRISSDKGPSIFAPDWTKGPDAPRVVEHPSSGRWYRFPLEDVQVHLLESVI